METRDNFISSRGKGRKRGTREERCNGYSRKSCNNVTKNSDFVTSKIKEVIRLKDYQVVSLNKIATEHGFDKAYKVIDFLLKRSEIIDELMDYCGVISEEQFKKIALDYLPKNPKTLKARLANEFLSQLVNLNLINEEEYNLLAGRVYSILLSGGDSP